MKVNILHKIIRIDPMFLYMGSYNTIEAFVPLIGGGEFRWHFKHLSDQI